MTSSGNWRLILYLVIQCNFKFYEFRRKSTREVASQIKPSFPWRSIDGRSGQTVRQTVSRPKNGGRRQSIKPAAPRRWHAKSRIFVRRPPPPPSHLRAVRTCAFVNLVMPNTDLRPRTWPSPPPMSRQQLPMRRTCRCHIGLSSIMASLDDLQQQQQQPQLNAHQHRLKLATSLYISDQTIEKRGESDYEIGGDSIRLGLQMSRKTFWSMV